MLEKGNKLPPSFFLSHDVSTIAKKLVGKYLVSNISGAYTSGKIVETEAYGGGEDKASHAFGGKETPRNRMMFAKGGCAYIYLCYGIHHLFNIVTAKAGEPYAVLIRAIEPSDGKDIMLERRGLKQLDCRLCSGPAILCQALGISIKDNGRCLQGDTLWVEEREKEFSLSCIEASSRVGVAYAQEHALWNRRFRLKDSLWVSRAQGV